MSKHLIGFTFVLSLIYLVPVKAQNIVTDRPDQTESAITVPRGVFQLETGAMVEITERTRDWVINTNLFRYGLTEDLEMRLVTGLVHTKSRSTDDANSLGIGDMEVGLKYQFIEGRTNGAYLGHFIVPNGTREVSGGEAGMSHRVALSHVIADWFSVGYNLGIASFFEDGVDGLFTLSLGFGITERIGFFTEIYGEWTGFEEMDLLYDHGFTWLVRPNLQLDFSMGTGITSSSNFYSAGLSWYVPYRD